MTSQARSRKGRTLKILIIIAVLIVAVRLILPYAVLKYTNNALAAMPGYAGHIKDIDLALIRGAYKIDSIYLNKKDSASGEETPFFGARTIDLSVEWRSLLKGEIVGEIDFLEPTLIFTKDKVEPDEVKKDSSSFTDLLQDLMPLKVNRFTVRNGNIQYIDEYSSPKVDVSLTNTNIVATNLRNAYDSSAVLPATIIADANLYDGTLDFNMKLNPMAETPTFDLNAELKNTNLVKLNDFFEAYANVDISKGTLGLYTEIAAKDGRFNGYVKPLLHDVSVVGKEDRDDSFFQKLWEGFVGTAGQVIENIKKEQVATKIPFQGEIEDPKANIWYTITSVLQNAFVRAIQPSIDHEINLATVDDGEPEKKGFLEKIFGKKDDKKKEKQESADKKDKKKDEDQG
jgi:Domain of Unknown Function (DUF748).